MALRPKLQLKLKRQATPVMEVLQAVPAPAAQSTQTVLMSPSPHPCAMKRARSVVYDELQYQEVVEEFSGLAVLEAAPAQVRRIGAQSPEASATAEVILCSGAFGKVVPYPYASERLVQKIAFSIGHRAFNVELEVLRATTDRPHQNVLALHKCASLTDGAVIIVPQAECDLFQLMEEARLKPAYIPYFMRDILAGLAHLHGLGWLHCDLSPENILVFPNPEGAIPWRCVVCDFGSACKLQSGVGRAVTYARPKDAYAAPEQLTGSLLTPATDVFTVGVIARLMMEFCRGVAEELAPFRQLAAALKAPLPTDRPSVHAALASIESLL